MKSPLVSNQHKICNRAAMPDIIALIHSDQDDSLACLERMIAREADIFQVGEVLLLDVALEVADICKIECLVIHMKQKGLTYHQMPFTPFVLLGEKREFIRDMVLDAVDFRCLDTLAFILCHYPEVVNWHILGGVSILHYAIQSGDMPVVAILLQCPDINVDELNMRGFSPLMAACQGHHLDIVNALLIYGANTTKPLYLPTYVARCARSYMDYQFLMQLCGLGIVPWDDTCKGHVRAMIAGSSQEVVSMYEQALGCQRVDRALGCVDNGFAFTQVVNDTKNRAWTFVLKHKDGIVRGIKNNLRVFVLCSQRARIRLPVEMWRYMINMYFVPFVGRDGTLSIESGYFGTQNIKVCDPCMVEAVNIELSVRTKRLFSCI